MWTIVGRMNICSISWETIFKCILVTIDDSGNIKKPHKHIDTFDKMNELIYRIFFSLRSNRSGSFRSNFKRYFLSSICLTIHSESFRTWMNSFFFRYCPPTTNDQLVWPKITPKKIIIWLFTLISNSILFFISFLCMGIWDSLFNGLVSRISWPINCHSYMEHGNRIIHTHTPTTSRWAYHFVHWNEKKKTSLHIPHSTWIEYIYMKITFFLPFREKKTKMIYDHLCALSNHSVKIDADLSIAHWMLNVL